MIKPIAVNPNTPEILASNIFWMIGIAAVMLPLIFLPKRYELSRYKGFLLFGAYMVFIYISIK
jgi:cation:H+ antiporter